MIISLSQRSYALNNDHSSLPLFSEKKVIWKSLGSQFFRYLIHSLSLLPSTRPVLTQFTHCARTLRRQETWHYIKIAIFFLWWLFFRSKQFCDAASSKNCNSRDSKQEVLLNSSLKTCSVFHKGECLQSKVCQPPLCKWCYINDLYKNRYRFPWFCSLFCFVLFTPCSVFILILLSKSKTREQCFLPHFKPEVLSQRLLYRGTIAPIWLEEKCIIVTRVWS